MTTKKAKKCSQKTVAGKPPQKHSGLTEADYDEVDQFHAKKDQILLEEDGQDLVDSDEADYDPDTILDLPEDDGEEDEDEDWKQTGQEEYDDDELFENDHEDEEDDDQQWGQERKHYYSADVNDGKEEAVEGDRLYKKKLASMSLQDFGVKEGVLKASSSAAASLSSKKAIVKSVTFDSEPEDHGPATGDKGPLIGQIEHELDAALTQVKQVLQPFIDRITKGDLPRSDGLSFLQTKYNLLLHYCINAVYYVKSRASGKSLPDNHPVIERLVKYKVLIEKMKPLEAKLKPQIDNLLKAAASNDSSVHEEDHLRPHIELITRDGEEDGADRGPADGAQKYRPPKVLQTEMFDQQKARKSRPTRIQEELLKEELLNEEAPEEESVDLVKRVGGSRSAGTLDNVEEDNFVRFSLSKKEKRRLSEQAKIVDGLDDLNDMFDEFERRRPGKRRGDSEEGGEEGDVAPTKPNSKSKPQKYKPTESESEIESDSDGYQEQVKSKKQANKPFVPEPKRVRFRDIADQDVGRSRPASKNILNNRGLTPSRPRDIKNPRMKQRKRFEKATKRLSSFRAVARADPGAYRGEATGIRKDISRSHKF